MNLMIDSEVTHKCVGSAEVTTSLPRSNEHAIMILLPLCLKPQAQRIWMVQFMASAFHDCELPNVQEMAGDFWHCHGFCKARFKLHYPNWKLVRESAWYRPMPY
jgi:hypothetical protein